MPDLLREQFPHLRPIVEAFGYRNLEFEGWEADDVIATLATRADEAAVRTCVVSTDRDAFQLCTDNICLMMTPRGVADVHVYTPERVVARYGVTPEQVPDFIGLKGDTSDNIPGVPGIGDKTAGQLIAQYGSLEAVLEHVDELSPGRAKALRENAEQALASKELATMRRDLPLDVDPAALVLSPPDRSQLKEIFRRFEFRNLLRRVDELDEALPAAPGRGHGRRRPLDRGGARDRSPAAWRSRSRPTASPRPGRASRWSSAAGIPSSPPVSATWRSSSTTPRRARLEAVDDTLLMAYLIEPGRAAYLLDDLAAEYGVELVPDPPTDEETAALVRHAAAVDPTRPPAARADRGARPRAALPGRRAPAHGGSRRDGGRRRPHRHVPDGRDHRPARRPGRGARGPGPGARRRGVHARLDPAGGPDPLREARAHGRPQGQDRVLDRRESSAGDPRRARDRAGDRGVAGVLEAPEHVPRPPPETSSRRRTGACTRTSTRRSPPPAGSRRPARTSSPFPSGRSSAARSGAPSSPSRASACSRPTTRRSSCGSSPTSPASRSSGRRSRRERTSTLPPPPRCWARSARS